MLSTLAALHRARRGGWRGVAATVEQIAATVNRITGEPCGPRTCAGAARILEAAGLLERSTAYRGRPEQLAEQEGEPARWARRPVSCWTLTQAALDMWTKKRRVGHKHTSSDSNLLSANLAASVSDEQAPSGLCSARARTDLVAGDVCPGLGMVGQPTRPPPAPSATPSAPGLTAPAKARPSPGLGHGSINGPPLATEAASLDQEQPEAANAAGRAPGRAPPKRRYRHRPHPKAGNSYAIARAALLYDLETALIRGMPPPRREQLLDQVEQETRRHARAVTVPWDCYVYSWRGLSREDRARILTVDVLPALRRAAERRELLDFGVPDPNWRPHRPGGEPGPRIEPEKDYPGVKVCGLQGLERSTPELAASVRRLVELGIVDESSLGLFAKIEGDPCPTKKRT